MHPKAMKEQQVVADTTAQEKNITYPTDGKQGLKVCTICLAIARRHNLPVRRSYRYTLSELKRKLHTGTTGEKSQTKAKRTKNTNMAAKPQY